MCGNTAPLVKMFGVTEGLRLTLQCETCARAQQGLKGQVQVLAAIDPTVCTHCHTDYGQTELPRVGELPFCDTCREIVLYNRPFPPWLKLSFAGLLMLLAVALVNGAPYFRAARDLYRTERLLDKKQYAAAMPLLEGVLKIAPASEKALLLASKTYMLGGEPLKAEQVLKRKDRYKESPLASEVGAMFQRVNKAFEKLGEARKAAAANRSAEGVALIREAEKLYPEWPQWPDVAAGLEGAAGFESKDYDRFVAFSEENWKRHPQDSIIIATVASALACKYAVTGDPAFRARAEEMLEKARAQAASPKEKSAYDEYSERIRYRLRTREIIDIPEYNRRFRSAKKGK